MNDRFRKLREVFEDSLAMDADQRPGWIREACAGDPDLAQEVFTLLRADQQAGFLDQPLLPPETRGLQPENLGPYEILEEIGRGGMGTVYRAIRTDDAFRKVVAVKVIGGSLREGLGERFQRERQILAKLEHPNIARILDGGADSGAAFLVMEYVDGERIDSYCDSHKLDIRARLALFSQLCDAVDYVHRNLIVHRDIKPSNVLITADGVVKLLDFGIAKIIAPGEDAVRTQTVQLTPDFASPEQILGETVTPASDVYAIGVMLFQSLTGGAHPRRTTVGSLAELVKSVSAEAPPHPSAKAPTAWRKELRGDLDAIVLAALDRDPNRRYASAGRLGDDLRRFRDGRPVWAHADSTAYRAGKFTRRNWALLSAVAMVIIALTAGIATTSRQARIAQSEKDAAEQARIGERQQRVRAESALAEALAAQQHAQRETAEATKQRSLADRRYQDVRSLATTVLFDIHDQIKGLAGATEARRIAVAKALQYLDSLSQQSQGDIGLQSELAAAYERSGSILGNTADSAVEGAQASLPLYRKALHLRRQVLDQKPGDAPSRQALARTHELVGVGHLGLAQAVEAMGNFESAMRLFGANPAFQAEMLDRMGSAFIMLGHYDRALPYCQRALTLIQEQSASSTPDLEKLTARMVRSNGLLLRLAGRNEEAIPLIRRASDLLVQLMAKHPEEVNYRRSYATMLPSLARAYADTGRRQESDQVWTEARTRLTPMAEGSVDPQVVLSLAYALKYIARNRYRDHLAGKDKETGEAEMKLALEHSGRLATRPKAGVVEMTEYADILLKEPYPKLQNPKRALVFALRANELSHFRIPDILDTLAWAYFRTGDKQNAIKTMELALSLLPLTAGSANDRKDYTDALREFKESQ